MARIDSYSQHFLRSPRLVAELIGHTSIRKNDLVYDLGAGSGIISAVLAPRVRKVVAVELESGALQKLRANTHDLTNLEIVKSDIMSLKLPDEKYKIFANIPFHLSSPIVRKLTRDVNRPATIYLIVQKQFANKLLASHRHFTSQLGAELAPLYTARIRKPLRRVDFTPPPAVDTVLLELKLREAPLLELDQLDRYYDFIARIYTNPKYFHSLALPQANISSEKSPSQLADTDWIKLFETTR